MIRVNTVNLAPNSQLTLPVIGNEDRAHDKFTGVVISSCDNSLTWLPRSGFDCLLHQIFVYERCSRSKETIESLLPHELHDCVRIKVLDFVPRSRGRVHHAYLFHIVENWESLNSVTAFIKDSNIHSADKLAKLTPEVRYKSLAVDSPPVGRRGNAAWGLGQAVEVLQRRIPRVIPTALAPGKLSQKFVSFRSVFAASGKQIQRHGKKYYEDVLRFVLDEAENEVGCMMNQAVGCTEERCPNCELLERLWAEIMHCGEVFTPFHSIHSVESLYWCGVSSKVCLEGGGPFMSIDGFLVSGSDVLCLEKDVDKVIQDVHLAALLRWDIVLSTPDPLHESCPESMRRRFSGEHFKLKLKSELGLHIAGTAPLGSVLKIVQCKDINACSGSVDEIRQSLAQFEGHFVIKTPKYMFHDIKEANVSRGVSFVKSAFQEL